MDTMTVEAFCTGRIKPTEPVKAFVDDDGIYIPYELNPTYHRMLISKEL